jgi:transglutaminase-like putative cysteine protease
MRLSIRHEIIHRYERPVRFLIQNLRLTPRGHEGQHVVHWRIDVDVECRLRASQDAFGNIVHGFTLDGPLSGLTVTAIGEIETFDTRGVVAGSLERFPPDLYLRPTSLTPATPEIRSFADAATGGAAGELDRLHALLRAMAQAPSAANAGLAASGQSQAQSAGAPTPEALAQAFIACARHSGIPARYVEGYLLPDTGTVSRGRHGWAEAHVPGLGWVGFDPASGLCPDERYVRVAIGLDALGAAALRGADAGGADQAAEVKLTVSQAHLRDHG